MIKSLYWPTRLLVGTYLRWFLISYYETKSNYNNTKIGLLWVPLANMVFVVLLVMLFATGGRQGIADYFVYVSLGFMVWIFVADTLAQGANVFSTKKEFAISNNLNISSLLTKETMDRFFRHLLNIGLLFLIMIIFVQNVTIIRLLMYGLFLVFAFLTSYYLSYLLSSIVLLVPDIGKGIPTLTRFMFFASPVFWRTDINATLSGVDGTMNFRVLLQHFNPVSYYLSIPRQIFAIEPVSMQRISIAIAVSLLLVAATFVIDRRLGRQLRNIF